MIVKRKLVRTEQALGGGGGKKKNGHIGDFEYFRVKRQIISSDCMMDVGARAKVLIKNERYSVRMKPSARSEYGC